MRIRKLKKDISLFISSEEAKVLRKDVAKIGLTAGVIAAVIARASTARAQHTDAHTDSHVDHAVHSDSHSDVLAHADSHTDSHSDAHTSVNHNVHSDNPTAGHQSLAAAYNPTLKAGGHNSNPVHSNHTSHTNY